MIRHFGCSKCVIWKRQTSNVRKSSLYATILQGINGYKWFAWFVSETRGVYILILCFRRKLSQMGDLISFNQATIWRSTKSLRDLQSNVMLEHNCWIVHLQGKIATITGKILIQKISANFRSSCIITHKQKKPTFVKCVGLNFKLLILKQTFGWIKCFRLHNCIVPFIVDVQETFLSFQPKVW